MTYLTRLFTCTLESGANDGAAMPLLFLPLILINAGPTALPSQWLVGILIKKVAASIVFGVLFGLAANRMLKYSQYHDLIDKQSFIAFSLALSVQSPHT
jgi:NhaP-type Na+/H+ or K+/H+ antiporter